MDHLYRNTIGDAGQPNIPGLPVTPEIEPIPQNGNGSEHARVYAFVTDLFFLTKIQDTAKKLGIKVEFVKPGEDVLSKIGETGEKPSLIIIDLGNANFKPLQVIPKLKKELKKETSIVGFIPHVEGELKVKAMEAGCDMVTPRSAFSANLPQILRRHGAPESYEQ